MNYFANLARLRIIRFIRKWDLLNVILGFIDIFAIVLAFQLSYYINYNPPGIFFFAERSFLFLFLSILPFWLIILYLIKTTEIPRTKNYSVLLFEYFQSAVATGFFLLVLYFFLKMVWISRLFLIEFTFMGFMFLFFVRLMEYNVFKVFRAQGYNFVNVVIIADDTSLKFIDKLYLNKEWGYRIIAIFSGSDLVKQKYEKSIILLPEEYLTIVNDLMEVDIIDEVLYVKKKVVPSEVRTLVSSCEELGVVFRLKYEGNKSNLTNAVKTVIANEKFLNFINIPNQSYALSIKKIMDINLSLFMIIVLSPVLVLTAILIKASSPGPIIYRQARVGLRGRQFNLYKFRTMVVDAENLRKELESSNEADGPVFKIKNDPRVTRIGKLLRKSGLDELPQLFNVIKGEMSLIGPRPPLQSETLQYKRWQLRRLSVKPGLSCFWQIKPDRNNIKFEKWMELDLAYIDNWSIRVDIMILIKTIRTVFQRTGL